jgi:N-acetylneuraminic acid mutarotase
MTILRWFVSITFGCAILAVARTGAAQSRDDAQAITWAQLPPLPDPEGFAGAFAGVIQDNLVVAGGANIPGDKWLEPFTKRWVDSAYLLQPQAREWKPAGKLPRPCGYGVSISSAQTLICIGGSDAQRHYADVFQLTLRDGQLVAHTLPSLPRPCANACGALLDRTIYIAGGLGSPDAAETLHTFWALNLDERPLHWRVLDPWPAAPRMLAVAAVQAGSFFLMSGVDLQAANGRKPERAYLRDAWRFTPGHGWKRIADLPRAAAAAPAPAIPLGATSFLIVSGDDGENAAFTPVKNHPGFPHNSLAYDLSSDAWRVLAETPLSRATVPVVPWQELFVIPNGEVRPRVRTNEVWAASLRLTP